MLTVFKKKLNPSNQNNAPPLEIFDLLALSRKEQSIKKICRHSIYMFEDWKRQQSFGNKSRTLSLEGMLLKARARDFVLLYRMVRRDRVQAFEHYIKNLPVYGSNVRKSS